MSDHKSGFPRGFRGGVSRVTLDDKEVEHDKIMQHLKPTEAVGAPLATVGLSVSVGRSSNFAREKYEVTAWCSLPVPADAKSIAHGYDLAYAYVMGELERRDSDVEARFFPELVGHDEETNHVAQKS